MSRHGANALFPKPAENSHRMVDSHRTTVAQDASDNHP